MSVKQSNSVNSNEQSRKKKFEKEFRIRDSILTEKLENNNEVKTMYNCFILMHVVLLTYTILHDYTKTGELTFGFRLMRLGFRKFHLVILYWCVLNLFAFLTYYCFIFWARGRIATKPNNQKFWDFVWISNLLLYIYFSFHSLYQIVHIFDLEAPSAMVLFLEEIRLLMKQYAFIRSNAPRVLSFKPHVENIQIVPSFGKFVYFLFAPTIIYKDEYPRTQSIRWKFVFSNIWRTFCVIWFFSVFIERLLVPQFREICLRKYTVGELIVPILANSLPGMLSMIGIFYAIIHTTQNAVGELLRFGDKMFYREWWNANSLSEYYRHWNIPVHDWLFTYIYQDFYEIIVPKNKIVAQIAVFLTSAFFHEVAIAGSLRFFLPIHFFEFFVSGAIFAAMNITSKSVGSLFVLYAIVFGSGMQANLYTLEFFARINCPSVNHTDAFDFFKPRFLTCDCIE